LRQVTLNQVNPSRTVVNRTINKPVAINNAPIGYRPMAISTNSNRFNTPAAPVLRFRPQPRPVTTAQLPQSIEISVPAPRTYAIPNVGRIPRVATGRNVPNISPIPTLQAPYIVQSSNPLDAFPRSAPLPPAYSNTSDFVYPLAVPAPISSRYGWRIHPITGTRRFHTGMDLAAPMGAPVVAAISGRVVTADWLGGYGKTIVIQDGQNRQVLYGHLSEIMVGEGQIIEKGTIIGRVGSTGNSTGPHLHFEARTPTIDGSWVTLDPTSNVQYALGNLRRAMQDANRTSY
jgi:murein DD-endopeptidase MepM/ murein hydrolase activator NlpD